MEKMLQNDIITIRSRSFFREGRDDILRFLSNVNDDTTFFIQTNRYKEKFHEYYKFASITKRILYNAFLL
jgi:hypothetical protein